MWNDEVFVYMGIFFGNVWYAAIHKSDLGLSGVYMTSLMPDGTGRTVNGMETLSDGYCFDETTRTNFDLIKCFDETEAKQVVRREVIIRSEERHLFLASSLAVCDTQILLSKLKHDEKAVSAYKVSRQGYESEIKQIKATRRKAIQEITIQL